MEFHLNYTPKQPDFELHHGHKIFLIGSCFSENISAKLNDYRFKTEANPNGILFNPTNIHSCLESLIHLQKPNEKHLLHRNGIFFSYQHHSSIHDEDDRDLLKKINEQTKRSSEFLKQADYLIITFGSAFVYHHLQLNEPVSNCHKQPGHLFEKKLLTTEQVIEKYATLIEHLKNFNPDLKLIFTVSPVKYFKDGVVENNLSKATLLLSINLLVKQFPNCYYFPAFELVNDDLRDYRFYKEDLAHPNEQAIAYVWNKFSECLFSAQTQALNSQIHSLNQALKHRRLINNSEEALKLNDFIIKQKELIHKTNPEIDFTH